MNKLLIITFLLLSITHNSFARNVWVDNKAVCEKSRGVWRLFGNDCANNCQSKVDILVCTHNSLFACDCGKNRCWDGDKCVSIKSYKAEFDRIKEENLKKAEEEKSTGKSIEDMFKQSKVTEMQDKILENFNQQKTQNSQPENAAPTPTIVEVAPAKPASEEKPKTLEVTPPVIAEQSQDLEKKKICEQKNGTWKQFSNGCVGNCSSKISKFSMCTAALTFGCECGENKCWDSSKNQCMTIEQYQNSLSKINQEAATNQEKVQNKALQNNRGQQEFPRTDNSSNLDNEFLSN